MKFIRGVSLFGMKLQMARPAKSAPAPDGPCQKEDLAPMDENDQQEIASVSIPSDCRSQGSADSDDCSVGSGTARTRSISTLSSSSSSNSSDSWYEVPFFAFRGIGNLHEADDGGSADSDGSYTTGDLRPVLEPPELAATNYRLPSEGHSTGECKPCVFVNSRMGCVHGEKCNFCHLPHAKKLRVRAKPRRKEIMPTAETQELQIDDEASLETSSVALSKSNRPIVKNVGAGVEG